MKLKINYLLFFLFTSGICVCCFSSLVAKEKTMKKFNLTILIITNNTCPNQKVHLR